MGILHIVFTTRRGLPPVVRAFIDHLASQVKQRWRKLAAPSINCTHSYLIDSDRIFRVSVRLDSVQNSASCGLSKSKHSVSYVFEQIF